MIRSLRLKNLALADDVLWELGAGCNTLTGETGAGKSMLIGGLNLLLGERADKTLIRSGEQTCAVEAELQLDAAELEAKVNALLEEIGAEPCESRALLIRRSFTVTGSNKQFINGSPVTLAGLGKLGDLLVDVHGPHDHQSLLVAERQLAILDAYGKLEPARAEFRSALEAARELTSRREALLTDARDREQRIDMLTFQVKEIEAGALSSPTEDETVERDYRMATHAQQLQDLATTIQDVLIENDDAVMTQLAKVERALIAWQRLDPTGLGEVAARNREAIALLQDLSDGLRDQVDRIDDGAGNLGALEDRLNLIQKLKKKYGPTLAEVMAFGANAAAQLAALEDSDETLDRLAAEEKAAFAKADALAVKLGEARRRVAGPLAERIQDELRGLGFNQASFRIDLLPAGSLGISGADRAEFIFAPNVGEEPRPLRAIASSGEMARVMLAIKTTLAEVDEVPVLVFDEVDANVGGETAVQVGRKLRRLGESHQVICITHLPQVAAHGQRQFAVTKKIKQGRSVSEVTLLEAADRAQELARMLGGQSAESLALAESLLAEAAAAPTRGGEKKRKGGG